ncbi:ABC transporter permease subunit [Metabacillus idriensis]|uniref:ABC transporter permease subunit n=1 Tax=Metabacillus idriensis TaxID=324768 RepID=UPI00163AE886|nr:ABC transporter permease subunit [Metabacillus idriensis]QNG59478.1 ABC transporter permease subunit [Bacillus sp. PAMC26568]
MNNTIMKAMIKKDLMDIFRSKNLFATLIIIPILFSVILPAAVLGSALFMDIEKLAGNDARKLIDSFITHLNKESLSLDTPEQQFVYLFINNMLPSLFLLVPIITASVVAANSFVGEKERRTLESLLFSPVTIKTLFVSKVLGSFIPSLLVSAFSFVLSGIVINALGYRLFGQMIFPSANWLALILCLSPMVSLMTVLLNVFISSRVKTFQEAQNIGGVIILPVVGMMAGQASGLFLVGAQVILLISLGIFIINLILLQRITKYNDRYVLFEKQIH